jgi:uncharacterized repeat protein (TIGR01451 family)
LRRLALTLSLGAVAALAITSATAARVDVGESSVPSTIRFLEVEYPKVIFIDGAANKTCDDLDVHGSPGASWTELKFDPLPAEGASATKSDSYLSVTLTRTGPDTWSWTSTKGIDAVFIKSGASGSNLYVYDPPTEATSGTGLTVPGQNSTSHVAFCYDEGETPPPPTKGNLKVVKLIENAPVGVGFDDFSFSIDGGAAVSFDGDGVSDEYTFDAGTTHDVVEPGANGTGFTTSYSDECSDGAIVANQTITCTITNTYAPSEEPGEGKLKVVKLIENAPVGVGFDDFSFSIDGGAAVSFDGDGVSDEYTFGAGTTHDVVEPGANGTGFTTSYSDECSDGAIVANQTITCTITNTYARGGDNPVPPSPPPTNPPTTTVQTDEFMDVQVIKDATPQVQLVNGQADIAYTIRVRNNGPNQAHNVQLVDAAPSGVTFLAVTQQPVGGSCSISGGALLQCSLGTLGPGVERTIGMSARVTQTGTYVNSATGTGQGKDTNSANNRDDASTLVTAPVTPPTTKPTPKPKPKPKPHVKPKPDICRVLKVTPGLVKANSRLQVVLAKVTRSKTPVAGVAVRFTGSGLTKLVKTNKQGVARLSVKPSKAGIMIVRITSAKACNTARIGVVGVLEPPVTG